MTRQRSALYALLALVAGAAAVLSFSALRDLAITCGFTPWLAPLLPVVIDAGAAAASIVWLGRWAEDAARGYGRTLALVLLTGSVAGNALGHGLAAYAARPHWLVVVGVSAIAPTVLGALVHLLVLVGRVAPAVGEQSEPPTAVTVIAAKTDTEPAGIAHIAPNTDTGVGDESDSDPLADWRDRREHVDTGDIRAIVADLGRLRSRHDRTWSRDEIREMYRIGADKAMTARRMCGWPEPVDRTDRARLEPVR